MSFLGPGLFSGANCQFQGMCFQFLFGACQASVAWGHPCCAKHIMVRWIYRLTTNKQIWTCPCSTCFSFQKKALSMNEALSIITVSLYCSVIYIISIEKRGHSTRFSLAILAEKSSWLPMHPSYKVAYISRFHPTHPNQPPQTFPSQSSRPWSVAWAILGKSMLLAVLLMALAVLKVIWMSPVS